MTSVHLTNSWHARSGGIATFYRALLDEAERRGRSVALVVPGAEDGYQARRHTRIYTVKGKRSPFDGSYRMIVPNVWPGVNRRVAAILREERPNLIEVCDKFSLHYVAGLIRRGLFKLPHRPVLVGLSCERFEDTVAVYLTRSSKVKPFCRWYMKWVYFGFFYHHISVSTHASAELGEAGRGHRKERGVWIRPMGVDLETFHAGHRSEEERGRMARQAGGDLHSRLLLYAGRLAPEKNLKLLVDTFERLIARSDDDYRLIVAGDGILREELMQECRRRFPGYAAFLGHVGDRRALARLYANADAFVHLNPAEPFGISPLEAMASGVPLVGPDRGGLTEYASARNAWLAPPTADAFSDAVQAVFADPDRELRVSAARETAESLAWPQVVAGFLDLYSEFACKGTAEAPAFRSTPGTWLGSEI